MWYQYSIRYWELRGQNYSSCEILLCTLTQGKRHTADPQYSNRTRNWILSKFRAHFELSNQKKILHTYVKTEIGWISFRSGSVFRAIKACLFLRSSSASSIIVLASDALTLTSWIDMSLKIQGKLDMQVIKITKFS